MVYRGKPSAGCENCRKAKKRCDLQQPACTRCVKLKKICSGYRDTTALQVHDESESVKRKAIRQKARVPGPLSTPVTEQPPKAQSTLTVVNGIATPESIHANSSYRECSSFSDEAAEPTKQEATQVICLAGATRIEDAPLEIIPSSPRFLKPNVVDIASTYFFDQFTAPNGHWTFLRDLAKKSQLEPVVDFAARACGIAALDNVYGFAEGREYSRALYAQALGRLNAALRDPLQSKADESLIAVIMLGYYENLTCDGRESIMSWKAHINGATQLLRVRGKNQFKSEVGRMLFREIRAQILIHCIWDDLIPPAFLYDWDVELRAQSPNQTYLAPGDQFSLLCFELASMRAKRRTGAITDADAMELATRIEMDMVQWSIDTMAGNKLWTYSDMEVADSPHVWNGLVHSYQYHTAANVWNTYRGMRIMLSRTQELLYRRMKPGADHFEPQLAYFRSVRRQMTDEVCAGVPPQLGHAAPALNSPCILITAYGSVWPLFFAGTMALERIGLSAFTNRTDEGAPRITASAAVAQTSWIIGRMEYISRHVGLRWADGIAACLKGDFGVYSGFFEDDDKTWIRLLNDEKRNTIQKDAGLREWIKKVEQSGRGPEALIRDSKDLPRSEYGPIWLGRATGENSRVQREANSKTFGMIV